MTLAAIYATLLVVCISLLGSLLIFCMHLSQQESPWWEGPFYGMAVSGCALAMTWSLLHPSPATSGAMLLTMAAVIGGLGLTQRPRHMGL